MTDPAIEHRDAVRYVAVVAALHVGPYRSRTLPDLEAAQVAFAQWVSEQGLTVGHETARGTALVCAVQHFRVGPVDEPDPSRWETELAMKLA